MREMFANIGISVATNTALFTGLDLAAGAGTQAADRAARCGMALMDLDVKLVIVALVVFGAIGVLLLWGAG